MVRTRVIFAQFPSGNRQAHLPEEFLDKPIPLSPKITKYLVPSTRKWRKMGGGVKNFDPLETCFSDDSRGVSGKKFESKIFPISKRPKMAFLGYFSEKFSQRIRKCLKFTIFAPKVGHFLNFWRLRRRKVGHISILVARQEISRQS